MPKEDRSDWVAVGADASSASNLNTTKIKPAGSAYQFFQKDITEEVKAELKGPSGVGKFNVADFSRLVKDKWNSLTTDRRDHYDQLAREDQFRFRQESHAADMAALQRREQLQKERSGMVMLDTDEIVRSGKRSTRRQMAKQERKKSRKEKKKDKKKMKHGKKKKRKMGEEGDDDDDEDFVDDGGDKDDDDDEGDAGEEEDESSDSYSEGSEDESSSDDDSDDSSVVRERKRKKAAAAVKRQPSAKQIEYRAKKAEEKQEREAIIAERQADVRKDKADQAKRRLEFLLKQSNIFSHFGQVKQDQARYGIKSGEKTTPASEAAAGGSNSSSRRDSAGKVEEVTAEDLEEADTHQATFLTTQPTTLGFGKMRQYQLEGLNWMIRLQENGVNGILADEVRKM